MPRLLADVARMLEAAFPVHALLDAEGLVVRVSEAAEQVAGLSVGARWREVLVVTGASLVPSARPEDFVGRSLLVYQGAEPELRLRAQVLPAGAALWALVLVPIVSSREQLSQLSADGEILPLHDPTPDLLDAVHNSERSRRAVHRTMQSIKSRADAMEAENRRLKAELRALQVGAENQDASATLATRQRLELLGQVAGSITHDFNNLLVAILGHAAHGLEETRDPAARQALEGVHDAAERAAALTARVLSLGSPTEASGPVDASREVSQVAGLLRRLLRDAVRLDVDVQVRPAWIGLDRTRLEQILVNLAINARDAMPEGGSLGISIARRIVDEGLAGSVGLQAGPTVCMTVRDTGSGMPREVVDRIFDPFFTTKGPGRGTGLGLATVHKVITEAGGAIQVSSAPGRGTTFSVWFPEVRAPAVPLGRGALGRAPASEGNTILLVDDEPQIRAVVGRMLRKGGWRVVEVGDVRAAFDAMPPLDELALVITDQNMPGGSGLDLVQAIRDRRADVPCIVMSGYSDDSQLREGAMHGDFRLLPKPFDVKRLLEAVNRSLSRARLGRLDELPHDPPTMPSWIERAC